MNNNITKAKAGFTLMEMLVTIAILMILAAVAVPNYRSHVIRTNRAEAMSGLMRIAAAQEKFYLQNNQYTTSLGTTGLNIDSSSPSNHYSLSVLAADQNGFNAIAVPTGNQAQDDVCKIFGIDEQGRKLAQHDDLSDTTTTCWR